jgi:hypothetical protein
MATRHKCIQLQLLLRLLCFRPLEPIMLEAGQTVVLTCDHSKQASSTVLPISYPSLEGTGLQPGRSVFVGQYLFTGMTPTQP